ncbi:hypothetical protein [Alphaproteobacteria bacterium endosymbiont of Tiliacea citrago]|uniref:hypothetical protein n=1 Tax=Alphaproteobacteria bacterium endosymbiont of Tiliacea citrago TaxID=3077944 RepID=UPI00313A9B80
MNNFVSASFYMLLCSLSCIISDTLSKLVSLDTNLLMLIRFSVSSIILLYCHYYVFEYEYWKEEYKKKHSTINSLVLIGNIVGSLFNFKVLNLLFSIKKIYDTNSKKAPTEEDLKSKNIIIEAILNFIKNPIFKIWIIYVFYITYTNLNLINQQFFSYKNSNITIIILTLLSIIIASNTEKIIIRSLIRPITIKKETILIISFLILSIKSIKNIKLTTSILAIGFVIFVYTFIRYCIKIERNIITYENIIRGLLFGIGMMLFTNGLKQLSLALVILLNFCTPIIVVILSSIILKEDLKHRLIVCVINTIGIFFSIYQNINTINISAILSIIGASICFAVIDVFNKYYIQNTKAETIKYKIKNTIENATEGKKLEKLNNIIGAFSETNEPDNEITIIDEIYENFNQSEKETKKITDILLGSSLVSSMFFLILVIFDQKNTFFVSILDVFYAILIGFLAILIPFFMLKASQKADLSSLQPLKYIEFPLSVFISCFLFNETFNLSFFIGFFIIIISTTYGYFHETKKSIILNNDYNK